jgi:hypothetical protein
MAPHEETESRRIAASAIATWHEIDTALCPIIGRRGVSGLYKRCLNLTRKDYAWLAAVEEALPEAGEFEALQRALSQQTSSVAAAASSALLQTFYNLLTNLIGVSLTTQLLQSVSGFLPAGGHAPSQDTSR